jgi:hypothetical protein
MIPNTPFEGLSEASRATEGASLSGKDGFQTGE